MWNESDVVIEIDEVEANLMLVSITCPAGRLGIIGSVFRVGRVLHIDDVHVQGLHPGALGRRGLNSIGRKFLAEADVEEIVIKGSARTTGKSPGERPRGIRFPRQSRPQG
jgi:hypothetical protein